jgi:hypothetical protein
METSGTYRGVKWTVQRPAHVDDLSREDARKDNHFYFYINDKMVDLIEVIEGREAAIAKVKETIDRLVAQGKLVEP